MTSQTQVSVQGKTFRPRDYDVFAGLDVDHHSIAATFTDHEGLLRSLRLPYSAAQLLNYVRKHFPEQRLAFVYEAGPTGFGLYDELVTEGHPCLVVAPSMVPRAPGARVKTNRLDSKKLSEGLRGGQLRSIHVPAPKYRELRHLVQLRDTHVQQLKATKSREPFDSKRGSLIGKLELLIKPGCEPDRQTAMECRRVVERSLVFARALLPSLLNLNY